jgi:uncharacterized protein (DUF488 family)
MRPNELDPAADYIFTVGHSNVAFEALLENLRRYEVEIVVDVRSQPASKYTPHFNRAELTHRLHEEGIRYEFAGDTLGGRPADTAMYDDDGYVRYDLLSQSASFREGISELLQTAPRRRTALLCSEEDPAACHRHLLIARVLVSGTADDGRTELWPASRIIHIRGDGSCQTDASIPVQADLFGGSVGWRSPQSVLHKVRPSVSSSD